MDKEIDRVLIGRFQVGNKWLRVEAVVIAEISKRGDALKPHGEKKPMNKGKEKGLRKRKNRFPCLAFPLWLLDEALRRNEKE